MTTESSSLSTANEAFVLKPTGQFIYESRNVPALRSTRDVMVRVVATGLCGSDVGYTPSHPWKPSTLNLLTIRHRFITGNTEGLETTSSKHLSFLVTNPQAS